MIVIIVIVSDVIVIFIIIVLFLYIIYQDGATALIYASNKGQKEVVQLLLDHVAGIDIKSKVSILYTIVCMYVCMYRWMNEDTYVCMLRVCTFEV